jgi:hypothetical protein
VPTSKLCSPCKINNCLGKDSRDKGQSRLPTPPQRITGVNIVLANPVDG